MILNNYDRFESSVQRKNQQGKSASKRIAMLVYIVAGIVFTLVAYTIITSDSPSPSPRNNRGTERSGFAEIPSVLTSVQMVEETVNNPLSEEKPIQPIYIIQRNVVQPPPAPKLSRVSEIRKQDHAQRLVAASAPTALQSFKQGNTGSNPETGNVSNPLAEVSRMLSNASVNATTPSSTNGMSFMPQQSSNGSDPNGWGRKDAFTRQNLPEEYSKHTLTIPRSQFELKSGTLLPCVLISGLNSDLPGNLTAQVSENVYDTVTGRYLLIPRGSRLIGTYDNQISYGQSRVLVMWNRLIFPDGSSLVLDNLKGADQAGYSGFKGTVNRHWGPVISSALFVSLLGAGVELASPAYNDRRDREDPRSILAENVASSVAQAMTQIIQREANRQPTIKVNPGYRFIIFVQHDIIFQHAWRNY